MKDNYNICCPNCGNSSAHQRFFVSATANKCSKELVSQIECPACDYLMVTCAVDGRVLEAYSPGLSVYRVKAQARSHNFSLQS